MTERDLQRWSREVAEDPGAPSFVRLARAYRREGRRTAAREVVIRGLHAHPEHVDAHALLALIHVEDDERQQARDEWETVLRLDPGNFDASRGLGFLALERGELETARHHLEAAAAARPADPAVSQALQVLDRREARANAEPAGANGAAAVASPGRDPERVFDPLAGEAPFRGALLLDARGLVLAGRLERGSDADLLGALLNTSVAEAERTSELLGLAPWRGMVLEGRDAIVRVAALNGGAAVVLVAERDAPAGWVVRTAKRATALAERFLGGKP
jgi:predicted regulator of Ras-like GTPase activity (Roadblock/LC7/MglB family)